MTEFFMGSVLKVTRQDTLEDIERNFNLMKECGHTTCVIWPSSFWWEEKTDKYPFNTGIKILEIAEKVGLKIVMELAGQLSVLEYIPDFLMKEEYLPVDENGNFQHTQGCYGFLNYFHPEVDKQITDHFKKTVEAYKNSKALIGYDVFNETMFASFDKYTLNRFRIWLKNKYGTIENLNRVWERTFTSWEQITFAAWTWMSIMPKADYGMFHKDSVEIFVKRWCEAVQSADSKHFVIADNIHSSVSPHHYYERPQDDYGLYNTVGKIGMSFYPKQVSGTTSNPMRNEILDAYYDATDRTGFWISEMQTHLQALFNPTTAVTAFELKRWCLEAYSSGAQAIIFWMWRPFISGLQVSGRGIVDYKGRPTERFVLAKELSKKMLELGSLTPMKKDVAILTSSLCTDLQQVLTAAYPVDKSIYLQNIYGAYGTLFENNIPCDIIREDELMNYKTVIAPNLFALTDEMRKRLTDFVSAGGTLILDGKFGVINEEGLLLDEIFPREFTGIDWYDSEGKNMEYSLNGKETSGYYNRELAKVCDGETVAAFNDGYPAVVKKNIGKGQIITFCTFVWYGYCNKKPEIPQTALEYLSAICQMPKINVNANLTVKLCESDGKLMAFIFNYTNEKQSGNISFTYKNKNYSFDVSLDKQDSMIMEV